jgi:hypothetical protein
MKTFNQFMAESKKKNPKPVQDKDGYWIGQTVFGSHSKLKSPIGQPDKDGYYVGQTVFGSHSQPKNVKEDFGGEIHQNAKANLGGGFSEEYHPLNQHSHSWHNNEHAIAAATPHGEALHPHFPAPEGEQYGALRKYTLGSKALNKAMIDHHTQGRELPDHMEVQKHHLQNYLTSHSAPHDMTVHSGTSHSPEHYPIDEKTGKRHMKLPAFTSTSIDLHTAQGFGSQDSTVHKPEYPGRHVLSIHVPKGSPGAYIDHHSALSGEFEHLLPHSSRLHIEPHPTTHIFDSENAGVEPHIVHHWHATLQPHKED